VCEKLGNFDINNKTMREARRYRTHAFAAELFAACPRSPRMAIKWAEIARLWTDLAALKERTARSQANIESQMQELKKAMADLDRARAQS
jgi:hypothetical protein